MPEELRVLISYSHDSPEHEDRVLDLANRLRADGVDAIVDQYEPHPPEGWPLWMERQIEGAEFVLLVCTEIYLRRVKREEEPGVGRGVCWEANLIYNELYKAQTVSGKFVPVLFAESDAPYIPAPLQGDTHYRVDAEHGYEALYRRLTGQPLTPMPELGARKSMPPRPRRSVGVGEALAGDGPGAGAEARAPKQWVMVTGSGNAERLSKPARWACEAVGERLAREGYGLVVRRPDGVDGLVAESFEIALRPVGRPLSRFMREILHQGDRPLYRVAKTEEIPHDRSRFARGLDFVGAVVIVMGGRTTQERYEDAIREQKPVLPLPGTSGTAESLYTTILEEWESRPVPLQSLSSQAFRQIDRPIRSRQDAEEVAGALVGLLGKILDVPQ